MRIPRMTIQVWMISAALTAVFVRAGISAETWWRLSAHRATVLRGYSANLSWYDEGRVTLLRTVRSSRCLLEAELAMCSTNSQQATAISGHLKRAHQLIERERKELAECWCRGCVSMKVDIEEAEATLASWERELTRLNGAN